MHMLGLKVKCRESYFFRGNSSLFYVVFVPSRARYKNNMKKTRTPEEKVRFPDISLFIPAYACIKCIDSFISQENLQKIREKISENVAKRVKKLYFLSLVTKSITFNP